MSILEKLGFKSREQKEKEEESNRLQGEIKEKQKELAAAIFGLSTFNKNLAEGGRMTPGDPGRRDLMEENISRIREELDSLKTRLPNQR